MTYTPGITAVIFDQGNVLDSHKESDKALAAAMGLTPEEFARYATPHVRDLHLGLDELEFLNRTLRDAGRAPLGKRIFREIYAEKRPFNEALLELNREVRELGYKTAVLSNAETPLRDLMKETYTVAPVTVEQHSRSFDAIVCSCDVGYAKPDREIYLIACARLEIQPKQAVFIDDKLRNVQVFQEELGGYGIHHTDNSITIAALSALLGRELC